jgi:AsmA protein
VSISFKSIVVKFFKITGLTIAAIFLVLFLAPILFPGTISQKVKAFANKSLDGELNFSKTSLSFFRHFPSFTITLYDFSLKGSAPFKKDTLVAAKEISLGINIKSLLFEKEININQIFVSNAAINVLVNKNGEANYNVYVPAKSKDTTASNDTSGTALKLSKIIVENSHLIYNDQSTAILLDAKGFNYQGNGDLSKAIFDLNSRAVIDSLNFYFDNEPYLLNKKVNAELITHINTNSFAFFFQKNNLLINKLPVQFSGNLNFLKNGYAFDFIVKSANSLLNDFVTALPPQFIGWHDKTTIKGSTDILLTLKGNYIASTNTKPDLAFNMKIRDGYIAYEGAPFPASNLFLNFETTMPAVNPDSLKVKIDSLFFNIDKDYLSAVVHTIGVHEPYVNAKINARMDLDKLDKAFGLLTVDLKGQCEAQLMLDGKYASGPNPKSLRHDTIILSVPSYHLQASVKDGYFKYASLPVPVTNINFNINSNCAGHDYQQAGFSITNLSATALNNFIKGNASVSSIKEMLVDANLQADINLGDIKNIYPVKDADLTGNLKVNIQSKGRYDAVKKTFPVTTADFLLKDGVVKTMYYPNPVSDIQIAAKVTNATGTLKGTNISIQPASFIFEGKPFQLQASIQNPDDIAYNIKANGTIDIARIYKVFAQKGQDISGFIKANLSLQGRQSDAMAGRYNKLHNAGSLAISDIKATTAYFPNPFFIKEGLFTFRQDKMWFKQFLASYGQSDFSMDGYLQNVIDYALTNKAILKGNFNVNARLINVDEFMAFAPVKDNNLKPTNNQPGSGGVVIVPSNLSLQLTASAKKIIYNGLSLDSAKANLVIDKSTITLKETGFKLIGCNVLMDASYGTINPSKAYFETHLQAKEFDIKRAYKEVKLFHDMATAAGSAQGIISLDYALKGKLDNNMLPIYPSLQGGGVISVKKIKMKGFKLLSAVGNKTGKDGIKDPELSKIDIKSKVKNNVISLEQFKIKMAGFRLKIEGQTNFNGAINMKMRLGLPPLGIIGIPMRITGTQENPLVKLGKGDQQEVPETEE